MKFEFLSDKINLRKDDSIKRLSALAILISVLFVSTACGTNESEMEDTATPTQIQATEAPIPDDGMVNISLSDTEILVDGKTADTDTESAVYTANDIIYYEDGGQTYVTFNLSQKQSGSGFMGGPGMPPQGGEPPQGGTEPPEGRIPPKGEPSHWN